MREVGGYRVEGVLGSGGMAEVLLARSGDEKVALKVLDGALCTRQARRRFAREAAAVARLCHPNVVRVRGFGETEEGSLYLAMELLEGESLDERLERAPLTLAELVEIACGAADGLGAAHAAGLVHRDVKPANLFLCNDGTVKVLDFGLAISLADAERTRLTAAGAVLGTPGFMAIEQVRGSYDVDARTDVWGLGATLYQAASGRTPFEAPTPMAELVRVATDVPDPLPTTVPEWLRGVILRALEREPAARWPSMSALREALAEGLRAHRSEAESSTVSSGRGEVPAALGDEVRIVSVMLAEEIEDIEAFEEAARAERGVASPLPGRRAVGVFGGDQWEGDEAERAVRAALAARTAARGLAVATGRGVKARAGEVAGAVVESAQGVLSRRGIGVDEETRRRIRGGFVIEENVVLARRPGHAIAGVRGLAGADIPLLGRDGELTLLTATLRQVIEESQAMGLLVVGPAGIGKSRLRHALQVRIVEMHEPVAYLEARGESHRSLHGWHAIANALRLYAELPEGTAPELAQERLLAICPTRPCAEFVGEILGARFPATPHLRTARSDPGTMRDRVVMAVGDLFESLMERQAVVLAVEDAQWADGASLELVELLLHRLESHPFFVLAAARSDLVSALPDLRRVALPPLPRRAIRGIVQQVLGDDPRADEIHERAEGNPYFAEELALALREGREVSALPASVESAVQTRLDSLARPEKDLLRRAAVLGRRFWTDALACMGARDAPAVLARLQRRELVLPEPRGRLAGESEWRFRHALVAEVAYGSLTLGQRAALHRTAGAWLLARPDAPAAEIARHLEQGGSTAAAAPHWRRAAEAAFREGDAALALEASGRALAFPGDRRQAYVLHTMRFEVLHFLGRADDEKREVEALEALASTVEERAFAQVWRAAHLRVRGLWTEAIEATRAGLALSPGDAGLLLEQASSMASEGRPAEAIGIALAAVEAARAAGDPSTLGRALSNVAHCHTSLGDVGGAIPWHERSLAAYEEAGDARRIAFTRANLAYCSVQCGRYREAVTALQEAAKACRAAGNRLGEGYALHNLGLARARLGDAGAGLEAEEAALALARETRALRLEVASLLYRAAILLESGRHAEALEEVERLLERPVEEQGAVAGDLAAVHAAALGAAGRSPEARAAADRALALRDAAGGLEDFEADLFLAAHAAGIDGALQRGREALDERARKISDERLRRSFLEDVPAHARLVALTGGL